MFDGSIENFVKELAPYKPYLKPTSYDIFKYIEETAKRAPQTHLSRALQILNEDAILDLRQKQLPIFKQIENEFQELPSGVRERVLKVLKIHKNRLKGIPQHEEFSPKDFSYKIKKSSETVVKNIHRTPLSNYADTMLATTQTKYRNIYDNNIINKTFQHNDNLDYNLPVNLRGMQLYLVEQIKKIGIKIGRNDILTTCKMAEDILLVQIEKLRMRRDITHPAFVRKLLHPLFQPLFFLHLPSPFVFSGLPAKRFSTSGRRNCSADRTVAPACICDTTESLTGKSCFSLDLRR